MTFRPAEVLLLFLLAETLGVAFRALHNDFEDGFENDDDDEAFRYKPHPLGTANARRVVQLNSSRAQKTWVQYRMLRFHYDRRIRATTIPV